MRKKNIIKKLIFVSVLVMLFLLLKIENVEAASASISIKDDVNVNTSTTISVSVKAAQWNLKLYVDGEKIADSFEFDSISNKSTSFSGKYTPKSTGKKTVTLEGTVTDENGDTVRDFSSKTITVKEKASSTNNNTSNSNTTNNNSTSGSSSKLSTDATLKNLGITPYDFTGFKYGTTTYSVTVPKSVEKISIYAKANDSKATVTGTGSKNLKIGKNTFDVKVTAEDKKTTKTYTLIITRNEKDEQSKDATLKNFGIRPKEYDFTGFRMSKTEYEATVPYSTEKITIYAYASNDNATVKGSGSQNLKVGKNTFSVTVTAEDKKTTKTYNLTVTRKEQDENEEENEDKEEAKITGVTSIKVEDYELSPKFDKDVYEYKVDVKEGVTKLDVKVETSEDVDAEVVGNEELKSGENVITILVRDTKTDATTTYQIVANVGAFKENTVAGTTDNSTNTSNTQVSNNTTNVSPEMQKYKSDLKRKKVLFAGVIAIIIILVVVFIIKKYKDYDKDDDEDDYESDDEPISETRRFYNQMKEDEDEDVYTRHFSDEFEDKKRTRGYKGRRFK